MTINLDFDGTVVSHDFPKIGKDIGAVPVLKKLVEQDHKLILFTMRSDRDSLGDTGDNSIKDVKGRFLGEAMDWFEDNGIPLYGVQTDPNQHKWTTSPKSYASLMIDDSSLGCPLKVDKNISKRPFVDWKRVEMLLIDKGILNAEGAA